MIAFNFPLFKVLFDQATGQTTTLYPDGTRSDTWIHWEDDYHGRLLGYSPMEHRLQHELAHHILGEYLDEPAAGFQGGCPIVWREAHGIDHKDFQPWSTDREWAITALQYKSRGLIPAASALRSYIFDALVKQGRDPLHLEYRINNDVNRMSDKLGRLVREVKYLGDAEWDVSEL